MKLQSRAGAVGGPKGQRFSASFCLILNEKQYIYIHFCSRSTFLLDSSLADMVPANVKLVLFWLFREFMKVSWMTSSDQVECWCADQFLLLGFRFRPFQDKDLLRNVHQSIKRITFHWLKPNHCLTRTSQFSLFVNQFYDPDQNLKQLDWLLDLFLVDTSRLISGGIKLNLKKKRTSVQLHFVSKHKPFPKFIQSFCLE